MIFGTGNGTFAFNNSKTGAKLLELNPGNVSNFYGNGIRVKGAATAGLYLGTTNHADGYYWSMADAGNVMLQVAGPNYAYYNNGTAYDFTVGGFSKHALLIDNNGLVAVGGIINPIAGLHTTSFATRVIKVTANYTVGALIGTVYCTGTGGYTITFPPALANTDRIIAVSNSSTGIITLTGSYFIGGVSPTMAPGTSAVYHANEDSYWIKESEVAAGGGSSSVTVTATGDATGTSTTGSTPSLPLVLATVNSNTGPIGSATSIPIITLDAKGRATAATTATIPSLSTGTFTPTMGSSTLTSSVVATTAYYTKMGNFTRARITGTFTSTGTGLGGFSFTLPNSSSESASQIGVTAIGESSGNKPAAAVTSLSTSTSGYVQYTSTVAGSNTYVILLDYAN